MPLSGGGKVRNIMCAAYESHKVHITCAFETFYDKYNQPLLHSKVIWLNKSRTSVYRRNLYNGISKISFNFPKHSKFGKKQLLGHHYILPSSSKKKADDSYTCIISSLSSRSKEYRVDERSFRRALAEFSCWLKIPKIYCETLKFHKFSDSHTTLPWPPCICMYMVILWWWCTRRRGGRFLVPRSPLSTWSFVWRRYLRGRFGRRNGARSIDRWMTRHDALETED